LRCSRKQLAEILGPDVKTLDRMVADGMPYVSRPGGDQRSWVFDTGAIVRWMTRDEYAEKMKEYRSRLIEAKAGIKWLEYGQALGFLVHIDDIMPKYEEMLQVTKSGLYAMPGRLYQLLAVESDPKVIERIVRQEIDDIFAQMDWMTRELAQVPPK
jgi:hypothetical protein